MLVALSAEAKVNCGFRSLPRITTLGIQTTILVIAKQDWAIKTLSSPKILVRSEHSRDLDSLAPSNLWPSSKRGTGDEK